MDPAGSLEPKHQLLSVTLGLALPFYKPGGKVRNSGKTEVSLTVQGGRRCAQQGGRGGWGGGHTPTGKVNFRVVLLKQETGTMYFILVTAALVQPHR